MVDVQFDVVSDGPIDFDALGAIDRRPSPFTPGEEFWTDPYVSERLLDAHLDGTHSAASRPPDRIEAEVDWLIDELDLAAGDAVVDFECGPGLYAERLADRGLQVTGLDVSETAIEYARKRATETGRDVDYQVVDYREFVPDRAYDAAILINTDFGTFGPEERRRVLDRIRAALNGEGGVAFDVLPASALPNETRETEWKLETEEGGFWRPHPHLVLSNSEVYSGDGATLDQHLVVEQDGTTTVYRFWQQHYSPESVASLLSSRDFDLVGTFPDLQGGTGPEEESLLGVVAEVTSEAGS